MHSYQGVVQNQCFGKKRSKKGFRKIKFVHLFFGAAKVFFIVAG